MGGDKKKAKKLANDFDFFIARSDLMSLIGKNLGPVLGPRGKMPSAVSPTVDLKAIVERARHLAKVRVGRLPTVGVRVGTEEMKDEEIADNVRAVIEALTGKLERGERNIKSVYLKTTMGPPVKL
jgi:large subunit ribosomal protein L1